MKDIALIQGRLEEYRCTSADEEVNAIREILQEMVLAGLSRTDFFVKAAFHGGTQLRIFEGVRRFSEDLDFALVLQDLSFNLLYYLEKVSEELSAVGVAMEVRDKSKASVTVKKGFLKNDSLVKILDLRFVGGRGTLGTPPKISIKIEVDAKPPDGATYRALPLLFPFPASVRTFDRESAFSGKMHALLCRQYVKGRDWFDFVWYAGVRAKLNHGLLSSAIDQQGPWAGKGISTNDEWVRDRLLEVIDKMDWDAAKRDVLPFVYQSDRQSLDLWNRDFFSTLTERLF
jgi:hypothetical protein